MIYAVKSYNTLSMKRHSMLTLIIFCLAAPSCMKSGNRQAAPIPRAGKGTLVASDPRTGACEGGIFIQIDGYPNPDMPQTGYFDIDLNDPPADFPLDNVKFPTRVNVVWYPLQTCGGEVAYIIAMSAIN